MVGNNVRLGNRGTFFFLAEFVLMVGSFPSWDHRLPNPTWDGKEARENNGKEGVKQEGAWYEIVILACLQLWGDLRFNNFGTRRRS